MFELLFLKSPCNWGFIFGTFLFVCLFVCFCFCNAASSKACWELSNHHASCFMGIFYILIKKVGGKGWRRVHGFVIKCLLYFFELWHQHCKAYCLFWTFILTLIFLTYVINVFSLQCNAFLRQSHPHPTWRQAWVKIKHDRK